MLFEVPKSASFFRPVEIVYEKQNLAIRGLGLSCFQVYLDIAKHQLLYANSVFKFDQMETALCCLHRRTYEER